MTDILQRLAALTQKDPSRIGQIDDEFCTAYSHATMSDAPAAAEDMHSAFSALLRLHRHREQALIALVQEAAREIERLRGTLSQIASSHHVGNAWAQGKAAHALNPTEAV
jgi:hypothetical protein